MSTDICLPRVSPDDAAVTLVKWHVAVGTQVNPGDVIAEIESDKAVVELEAEESGTITEIRVPEGSDNVHADQVLAVLDETNTSPTNPTPATKTPPTNSTAAPVTPPVGASSLANEAPNSTLDSNNNQSAAPDSLEDSRASSLLHEAHSTSEYSVHPASTLAARMARQAGITLDNIRGSGADGRILADDVRAALGPAPGVHNARATQRDTMADDATLHGGFEPSFDIQTPDNMRRVIAERLAKSKREAPHFYMSLDCRADALLDLKVTLNSGAADEAAISLNDLILKVTATALKHVPALNAAWSEAGIRYFHSVDLAVAVAIQGGLITPVIRGAENKRIAEIGAQMRDLVSRARAGQLSRDEYQGGTFTVSNMGMYGVGQFTAVINPPQAAILAVGAASERPLAENGLLTTAMMMTCTLSVDHRVADGVAGAEFLQTFRRLAEDPRLLLI